MIIPMLCVTIFVILGGWFLLQTVARLMIHTPTAISIFVCLSMVQLMAVFISMRCTLCGHFLQVAWTLILLVFFFQAEDGIRCVAVTGVQTCALPISSRRRTTAECSSDTRRFSPEARRARSRFPFGDHRGSPSACKQPRRRSPPARRAARNRSEERRVGKECRSRWSPYH